MRSRILSHRILSSVLAFSIASATAHAAVADRLARPLTTSGSRATVQGTVMARAKRAVDQGGASTDRKLSSLSLRFNMTAAQQADLAQLQVAQTTPGSSSYHQWLTPEQFGARFGMSANDIAKVSAWLTSQGFTVTATARSSTFIQFSGTVGQVEQAFGTTIHSVTENGVPHLTNLSDPTLPAALASVVSTVTGLNDFHPHPHSKPRYTQTINGTTSYYISPSDLYTIYDFTPLQTGSTVINGTGVTIAVMGQTDLTTANTLPDANITAFRTAAGLPAIHMTQQLAGFTDPGLSASDVDEAHIDLEWSGAAAPGATIKYVYGVDIFANSLTYAIDQAVAPIVTISYGECESDFGTTDANVGPPSLTSYNQLLAQANVQGMTVMASAGDSGAADCDTDGLASEGLNVDFPGSSPFVTAAGGTMFSGDTSSPANYWNSSNSTSGGSALKYIPETVWNETTTSTGLTAGGAGGGGASAFFSKPSWQTGTGVPSDSSRDVPDISLNAAANHDGYMVCTNGSGEEGDGPCSSGFLMANGTPNVFGGTSFVAPITAGVLALVEQKLGVGGSAAAGLGNINPTLYGLASGPTAASVFHDITSGTNAVPCSQGTPNCPNGGSIGYNAGTGYDQATGLGSYDVTNLVNDWATATQTGTGGSTNGACNPTSPTTGTASCLTATTVTTNASMCAITSGSLSVTVSVAGAITGTMPTGTVQFYVDSKAVGTAQALTGGTVTYSLPLTAAAGVTSGGHQISAVYSGDANYAGSKGTLLNSTDGTLASVDVVSTTSPDFSITAPSPSPCIGTVSVNPGATSSGVVFTVTSVNGFTGAVNMTFTNNMEMVATPSFTVTPVSITSAGGTVTTSFVVQASQTVTTSKNHGTPLTKPNKRASWYEAGSGTALACMILLVAPRRRRWNALLIAILSVAALTVVGCGGNTSSTGGSGGSGGGTTTETTDAQAGTYTFTVTGVSGSLVHSAQVTVTVP